MKQVLLLLLVIAILATIFLNRSYAYFFNFQGAHLMNPPAPSQYQIPGLNREGKELKYVAIGDSLTAGTGSDNYQDTYPYLIAEGLAGAGKLVNVVNLGQPGAKAGSYQLDIKELKNSDIVTILLGINDAHDYTGNSGFAKDYQQLIDKVKQNTNAKIILLTIPYLGSNKITFILYRTLWNLEIKSYNSSIKQLAETNGLKVIDLYDLIGGSFDQNNTLYSVDQFHPSNKGYILFGKLLNESRNLKP